MIVTHQETGGQKMKMEVILERGLFSVNINPHIKICDRKISKEKTFQLSQTILQALENLYEGKPEELKVNHEIHVVNTNNAQEPEKEYWFGKCQACESLNIVDIEKIKGNKSNYCPKCGHETDFSLEDLMPVQVEVLMRKTKKGDE